MDKGYVPETKIIFNEFTDMLLNLQIHEENQKNAKAHEVQNLQEVNKKLLPEVNYYQTNNFLNNSVYLQQPFIPVYNPIYFTNTNLYASPYIIEQPKYLPFTTKHVEASHFMTVKPPKRSNFIKLLDSIKDIKSYVSCQKGLDYIQNKLNTCSYDEIMYLFIKIKPYFIYLMKNNKCNYLFQSFVKCLKKDSRLEVWKIIKYYLNDLAIHEHATFCIQELVNLAKDEDEQIVIIGFLQNHFSQISEGQNSLNIMKEIINNYSKNARSSLIKFLISNLTELSKQKYSVGIVKLYIKKIKKYSIERKNIFQKMIDHLDEFVAHPISHYIVLLFISDFDKKELNNEQYKTLYNKITIMNSVDLLQNKYFSRIIQLLLDKDIEVIINNINWILLSISDNDIINLLQNSFSYEILLYFLKKSSPSSNFLLKKKLKEIIELNGFEKWQYEGIIYS